MIRSTAGRACGYPRKARTAVGRWHNNRHTGAREYGPVEADYLARRAAESAARAERRAAAA